MTIFKKSSAYKGVTTYYIGEYLPSKSENRSEFTKLILSFKSGNQQAVDELYKQVNYFLNSLMQKGESFYISTIPSSTMGKPHPGFPKLISALANSHNIANPDRNLLKRIETKQPAHLGGSRLRSDQLRTMAVANHWKNIIPGKKVILLDDVTTSGNSLSSGIDLLTSNGANIIAALAMAKTVHK